jgi:hypothetical protein
MAELATLQARLEKLDAMIASGVLTSKHGETLITYRSMDELLTARALLEKEIAAASGTPRVRMRYAYQSGKGL